MWEDSLEFVGMRNGRWGEPFLMRARRDGSGGTYQSVIWLRCRWESKGLTRIIWVIRGWRVVADYSNLKGWLELLESKGLIWIIWVWRCVANHSSLRLVTNYPRFEGGVTSFESETSTEKIRFWRIGTKSWSHNDWCETFESERSIEVIRFWRIDTRHSSLKGWWILFASEGSSSIFRDWRVDSNYSSLKDGLTSFESERLTETIHFWGTD